MVGMRSCFITALAIALVGCGPGILSPDSPSPPLFNLKVQTASSLTLAGDVRGALAWSVYSDELVACMDELVVNGIVDLDIDEQTGLPRPEAEQLVRRMQSCMSFSERGHVETDSVAIQPQFPSSFTIPVATLPDESVLTGHAGARLGIGDVLVYIDDNGDNVFSETQLGAAAFVDRVVGTSRAWREEDSDQSFLVWREGGLSSVWKLYRGIYGCPDPAEGFSTVTLRLSEEAPYVECVIDDAPVTIELDDDALGSLACAADPDRHVPQRPSNDLGLPAGAIGECGDGGGTLRYTIDSASVCPDLERYDLVGCSDLGSEDACRATDWDLVGNEPAWWPCTGGNGLAVWVADHASVLTNGVDALFDLSVAGGLPSFLVEGISVVIEKPDGDLVLSGEALSLDDADNNGSWSTGDTLTVRELEGESFTAQTIPGYYPVRVYSNGIELVSTNGAIGWSPVELPVIAPIEVTTADAAATLSFGNDEIGLVTWAGVPREPIALEDLHIGCLVGGEMPAEFGAATQQGAITLADDADDDGLFSLGDTLLLVERENVAYGLDPDGFSSFGGVLYCNLSIDVGFNAFVTAANFVVLLDGTELNN